MSKLVSSVEEYRLIIEGELLTLIQQAIELEKDHRDSEDYSTRRDILQDQLYNLYEEIGWSVVYDFNDLPF